MRVTLRFYSGLERFSPGEQRQQVLELPENSRLRDLLEYLQLPPGVVGPILVNGQLQLSLEYQLAPDDYIELHPLFAGG